MLQVCWSTLMSLCTLTSYLTDTYAQVYGPGDWLSGPFNGLLRRSAGGNRTVEFTGLRLLTEINNRSGACNGRHDVRLQSSREALVYC